MFTFNGTMPSTATVGGVNTFSRFQLRVLSFTENLNSSDDSQGRACGLTTCHVTHALPNLFTMNSSHPNNRFLLQLIKRDYYRNGERKSDSSDPGQHFFSPKVSAIECVSSYENS